MSDMDLQYVTEINELSKELEIANKKLAAKIDGFAKFINLKDSYELVNALNVAKIHGVRSNPLFFRHEKLATWIMAYQLVMALEPEKVLFGEPFIAQVYCTYHKEL